MLVKNRTAAYYVSTGLGLKLGLLSTYTDTQKVGAAKSIQFAAVQSGPSPLDIHTQSSELWNCVLQVYFFILHC